MKISILTLFTEMFTPLKSSIIGKALDKNLLDINIIDIRDYSKNKHKKCDDYPYGGGSGMVMNAQPIYDAIKAVDSDHKAHRIYLSPKGEKLTQNKAEQLSKYENLLLLCGHYEGVDQRAIDLCIDEEISIGDYVLTGGEIPAMVLVDCISRYIPKVLHSSESVLEESFSNNLLEYPQYTRPEEFLGLKVPDVLLSGNHKNIEDWRKQKQQEITAKIRPELIKSKKI